MKLQNVSNRKTNRLFLDVPRIIYRNDPTWVCPLDNDIMEVFNPLRNTYFQHGVVERWVLTDDRNKPAGRIAAFIDYNLANSWDQPTGGIGFFECINDQEAANLLFTTAQEWLKEKGMEAMDGPINFGETDKFW
ncbi:MAG TPA: GNAT family N-acetyltransferase, partial [Prolixibacteraceae bacterium]|nr:GNAT family N-acetyltransferase [Prolixibacteraceae bacterium]